MNKIEEKYFDWMYNTVYNDKYSSKSYKKLFHFLYAKEFIYTFEMDGNRAQYGIEFRYKFGCEFNYSDKKIKENIDNKPCSVLEMMIALAYCVEDEIMKDESYGNRIGQWFWAMIASLELGKMYDSNFNEQYTNERIDIFLNRKYSRNGMGGLFTIENPQKDMKKVDIWTQCMAYLNYIIES